MRNAHRHEREKTKDSEAGRRERKKYSIKIYDYDRQKFDGVTGIRGSSVHNMNFLVIFFFFAYLSRNRIPAAKYGSCRRICDDKSPKKENTTRRKITKSTVMISHGQTRAFRVKYLCAVPRSHTRIWRDGKFVAVAPAIDCGDNNIASHFRSHKLNKSCSILSPVASYRCENGKKCNNNNQLRVARQKNGKLLLVSSFECFGCVRLVRMRYDSQHEDENNQVYVNGMQK